MRRFPSEVAMRRIALMLAVAVTLTPLFAAAQRPTKPSQIGLLHPGTWSAPLVNEFQRGLLELGYRDGENIIVEYRAADNDPNRLRELVAELVALKVDVIVVVTSTEVVAARKVTDTIPIVMINVGDPVRLGLVASLSRPAGNVTGLASYGPELVAKQLEVLKELVPAMQHVSIFWTPPNP